MGSTSDHEVVMNDRSRRHQQAEDFFEGLWKRGDPWEFETSEFERAKYDEEIRIVSGRRHERVLEMGCGAGAFTRRLSPLADRVLALDVSPTAIARAREAEAGPGNTEFRVQNIMDFDLRAEGFWDLVVLNETIYYLGWLYTFFEVAWFGTELFNATLSGGHLLMANTFGEMSDHLISPTIIRTYHDLFKNVGYEQTSNEVFRGTKSGVELEVLISLFTKPALS